MRRGGDSTISRTFEWDAENRVTRIAEGNNDTEYRYSAEGHRTLERGPAAHLVRQRALAHRQRRAPLRQHLPRRADGRQPPHAARQVAPPPRAPTPPTACACPPAAHAGRRVCRSATSRPASSTRRPAPASRRPTRTIYFLHKDLQGSLRVATDEVGNVFQYVDYLPNGRPWVAGQSTIKDTPYLFAGGWTDTTYDLVNFGERWYEPRERAS